jgi:hypothetical protein
MIVFARRPGRFALVFDTEGRKPPLTVDAEPDRHFFGHGVYASDGKLLFSSENDIREERGVLGIRDATDGYRPIGCFATAGIGPHDVVMLSDGRTLAVANGGIDTDPNGRDVIDLPAMRPSLAYVDLRTGDILEQVELARDLRFLSIRHLALGTGDVVLFGCQWAGERTEHPLLVGLHRRGDPPVLLEAPADVHRRLRGYIGSVAVDSSGELLAASSPKGGLIVFWDIASRRYLGATELEEVCGVAAMQRSGSLVVTSGLGAVGRVDVGSRYQVQTRSFDLRWDNHAAALS